MQAAEGLRETLYIDNLSNIISPLTYPIPGMIMMTESLNFIIYVI